LPSGAATAKVSASSPQDLPVPLPPPSHRRRFKATRLFTDREQPVVRFLPVFEIPPPPDAHRVLVFYGVGGEGKTRLVQHLRELLARDHAGRAGWATVNFGDAAMRRPAEALLSRASPN
jgi:Mrp family chromosome partitioning ATPase